MLALLVSLARAVDSHEPFDDVNGLRENERELRLRLAEVRRLMDEAGQNPKLLDLSRIRELTDEERRVKDELSAVLHERYRLRLEKRGATLEPTKTSRPVYAGQDRAREREMREAAMVQRARQAARLRWGFAAIVGSLLAIVLLANLGVFGRFRHKKDEDIRLGDRKYA
jgi:hypothetical protein